MDDMNKNDVMTFSKVMSRQLDQDGISVVVPEKWGQGRATFGGLVAAFMYEKLVHHVEPDRAVRSLQISFVGPVQSGPLDIVAKVLRAGKGATQVQATAYQNDKVCAVMLGSFGADRSSAVEVPSDKAPSTLSPDEGVTMPFIQNLTPDFTQYFDYRFTQGKLPFMGSEEPALGGWIRFKEPSTAAITVSEILALVDAWPPATFTMLKKPTSGSSLSWTINFVQQPTALTASDWWQYQAVIQQSKHGYGHVDATLWDQNGEAVAISRQTVSVFG